MIGCLRIVYCFGRVEGGIYLVYDCILYIRCSVFNYNFINEFPKERSKQPYIPDLSELHAG